MDVYTPQPTRRHNPVDSICRKLQTIQWCGEREPNSPFQIPKFSSSSYDSPQCGLRRNVEAILKKGARHRDEEDEEAREGTGGGMGIQSSAATRKASLGDSVFLSTPCSHSQTTDSPGNVTYTIMSTLGERRGDLRQSKKWQRCCSTPTTRSKDCPTFSFVGEQREGETPRRSPPLSCTFTPYRSTFNLNFCSAEQGNAAERELPYPALVVKRLSLGDGGETSTPSLPKPQHRFRDLWSPPPIRWPAVPQMSRKRAHVDVCGARMWLQP